MKTMTLNDIRRAVKSALGDADDADAIICHVYGIDKAELYLRLFDDFTYSDALDDIVRRRTSGEPLEYIIGKATFCGIDFFVSPDCLIPQADTEVVVRAALDAMDHGRFLDLCTGSGCIAVALSKLGDFCGTALDISPAAIEIAKKNAASAGVYDKIEFVCADVFGDVPGGKFDLIISNPPYVESGVIDTLSREVLCEPRIALDGGDDGLVFYRRIVPMAAERLNDGGALVLEIGYDQAQAVGDILDQNGFEYVIIRDYGGNDRCAVARKSEGK
ncbi:MAG: peptide chain release factor N(5)-glutamine methyltransferase [Clostridia bacterium]|nr:peptide chain release factor N(5)-glutamine methyltransferase [Clostridia bacterium]